MGSEWQYGGVHESAGGRFAIARSEVWRVGDHFFAVGDLEGWEFESYLRDWVFGMEGASVRGMYCDPPWNVGIAGLFRRNAVGFSDIGLGGSIGCPVVLGSLFDRILGVCVSRGLRCVFEVGATGYIESYCACLRALRSSGVLPSLKVSADGSDGVGAERLLLGLPRLFQCVDMFYESGRSWVPCRGFCMDFSGFGSLVEWSSRLSGSDDERSVELFCIGLRADVGADVVGLSIVDPCVGLGTSSLGAARAGLGSFGFDMNCKKVAAAMKSVSRLVGSRPERVGVLDRGQ